MKKFYRIFPAIALLCALTFMVPKQSHAQWNIGASYEIRQETPKNGFGLKIERPVLGAIPVVNLRMRAHISYFSEDFQGLNQLPQVNGNYKHYDYGLAALAGADIGFVMPYAGLGLGATTFDVEFTNLPQGSPLEQTESDSKFHWNYFVGAEISPIPILHPFVEYRIYNLDEPKFSDYSSGRLIIGLSLAL